MMDMEWTILEVKDEDQYKASDNISDGELIESDCYRSQDESTELEGIKKNHNKTQEKEKDKDRSKEKDFESETTKDYGRGREKDDNPVKEKDKLKNLEQHKSRDREKDKDRSRERDKEKEHEQDRDGTRDGEEDKEKARSKEREKDKESISVKHRDKEKDRERGKEKDKSKLKEKDREEDRRMERKKDQETGIRDSEKQKEKGKERSRDVENERDIEIVKDRKEKERERDKEKDKEREKEKDRDKEGRERDRDKPRDKDRERERNKDKEKEKDRDRQEREREKDRDKVRDKERERDRDREREKEKERDKEEREKDRDKIRDKERERERDREREKEDRDKDRDKLRDKEREREKEKEMDKDEKERDKTRDREREREKEEREKDRDKLKDKERDRDRDKDREKDRDKERFRDRDRDKGREKVKERNRDRDRERESDRDKEREREERVKTKDKENKDGAKSRKKETKGYGDDIKEKEKNKERDNEEKVRKEPDGSYVSTTELTERLSKIRDEKAKTKSEGGSEILSWVNKSRKIEEHKSAEREKAARLAKIFEEQDNVEDTESDEEENGLHSGKDLAGLKVLHGLDKVMEGGAVVLTLKDQNVLAGDDVNDAVDMLENIEIGEQNARNEAYKAAKKKTGIYDDKFQNDINSVKSILPQYDEPFKEEGVTIDQMGGINEEAHNKLDEIRKRLQGTAMTTQTEQSLAQPGSSISDYYTQEEMLQFKKPKKKKKLRKKDKLDVDALEAEAIAAGLGAGDLGSRDDTERKVSRENAEKAEAELRKTAYQNAYKKAAEASRGLRDEKSSDAMQVDEDGDAVFGGEDEDLYKSLAKTRQAALRKQAESSSGSGPQAVARLAVAANQAKGNGQSQSSSDVQENKVVFTEMEEFVWSLQLDEDTHKPVIEDVFKEDDEGPGPVKQDDVAEAIGGWTEVKEMDIDPSDLKAEEEEEVVTDDIIKEASVGKGLAGALLLLKERGALKESVEWGGRNMDKKKSKLVGVRDTDGPKEIQLDRLDEFGRIMTPKEAFRKLSHKFHGKGPGKMKQEKRMKQYQEELKLKQMNTGDTPLMSMEKMRDIQAKLHTPYIVLSGQIKPGQTSDPRSGFATVEKEVPGSLTPMLGDRKVEHFLGIKRKSEVGTMGPPKKPKT